MGDSRRGLYLVGLLALFFVFVIYTNNSGFSGATGNAISISDNGGESIKNFVFILLAGALAFTLLMTKGNVEDSSELVSSESSPYMTNVEDLFRQATEAYSRYDYQEMEKAMAKINSVYQNLDENERESVYERVLVFYDRIRKWNIIFNFFGVVSVKVKNPLSALLVFSRQT